jgi:hypothetical protein
LFALKHEESVMILLVLPYFFLFLLPFSPSKGFVFTVKMVRAHSRMREEEEKISLVMMGT